jgi:hypothetical protein
MDNKEIEALYMTVTEVQEYLGVNRARVYQLLNAGHIAQLKGSVYNAASVEAYRVKRGDKKGGPSAKGGEK